MKIRFISEFRIAIAVLLQAVAIVAYAGNKADDKIVVSDNGRFLQYADGRPFFYLGDTAWELFHKLSREEADHYLSDRAAKGFTVVQAVALAELDGVSTPNAYGQFPLIDNDPSRPLVKSGENDYWDHVDYIVAQANKKGICVGMLPTWGRYWHDGNPIFNVDNAERYGRFLAERYKDANLIWILGGDRNPENEDQKDIIRAMARGLRAGDGGAHLITYHPTGWHGSAQFFHGEDWLDFNMRQNGHEVEFTSYSKMSEDYNREPVKPVFDGEPLYEDHPVAFQADRRGHSVSSDIRRAMYWDLFSGAFGHTYGHHSIWQMYDPEKSGGINNPLMPWREALDQPGAAQMIHGRRLIESRPYFTRVPATDYVLKPGRILTSMPGQGRYRFVATGDTDRTYAMVYAPVGREFTVSKDAIRADKVRAWWYNPRTGKATSIGVYDNADRTFVSPDRGEMIDWVLVLDDASKKYPAPGKPYKADRR